MSFSSTFSEVSDSSYCTDTGLAEILVDVRDIPAIILWLKARYYGEVVGVCFVKLEVYGAGNLFILLLFKLIEIL